MRARVEKVDVLGWNKSYINATRPKNCNGLRRSTDRDDSLGYTNDFETMSKTTAYRNHIKNSEIETREAFERKTSSQDIFNKHYQWIFWLYWITISLHDQRIVQNMRKRTNRKGTRTQNLHILIRRRHRHQTQDWRKWKARRRKSVVSIGKMTRQTHLRALTLILPMTVITDASDTTIRNIGKISDQTMRNFSGKIADDRV